MREGDFEVSLNRTGQNSFFQSLILWHASILHRTSKDVIGIIRILHSDLIEMSAKSHKFAALPYDLSIINS
jgi:hypothetical protein